jgi:tripartite-type tricarboxylate transporter receptor subunit TctC
MTRTTLLTRLLAAVTASAALAAPAVAQAPFPHKDITFVVPWNAGGANDVMMRFLQPLLKEDGLNLVIENVAGATGSIGLKRVATAAPDGYMIGMGTSSTLALIAQGRGNLKNSDFTNIARISVDPLILLVPGKSDHKTLEAFIAHMKANPGKVNIGIPGNFNLNHIFAAMTARAAGVDYINVVHTGGAKVAQDLSGNHLNAGVLKPSETLGQIQEKLVVPLGVFANTRLAQFPDLPTFKEKGHDVFPYGPVVQMSYVVAPAGLPAPVSQRLIAAFRKVLADKRFRDFAEKNSFLVDDLTGDALTKEIEQVGGAIAVVAEKVFPKTN